MNWADNSPIECHNMLREGVVRFIAVEDGQTALKVICCSESSKNKDKFHYCYYDADVCHESCDYYINLEYGIKSDFLVM